MVRIHLSLRFSYPGLDVLSDFTAKYLANTGDLANDRKSKAQSSFCIDFWRIQESRVPNDLKQNSLLNALFYHFTLCFLFLLLESEDSGFATPTKGAGMVDVRTDLVTTLQTFCL